LRLRSLPFALALALACGGRAKPPSPDQPQPWPPDLSGADVMVLPAQPAPGVPPAAEPVPGLDREIAFWLGEKAPRVHWIFPPEMERALARTPSMEVRIHALAVSSFHRGEVKTIGDPLFGDLRSLGALVNGRFALVPVAAGWVPDSTGAGRVELRTALIDTHGGRVLWFGVVAGQAGARGSPETAASAAEALAGLIGR
jgi:hypothetical protein